MPGSLPWSINYINSVTVDGERDALGMWFQETEGATFWMQVLRMSATPPCSSSLPGRPDEVRVSDCNGLCEGDEITIASRRWIVVAKEPAATERPDRLPVEERIVVVPGAAASGRVVGKRGQISSTRPRPSASRPVPHKPSATAPSKLLSLRAEEGW